MKIPALITLLLLLSTTILIASSNVQIKKLRIEMRENPAGLDTQNPRFMWQLVSAKPGLEQVAYQIEVADSPEKLKKGKELNWNSGVVYASNSLFIPYEGEPLKSRKEYYWRVKLYTNQGETGWSEIQKWSTAFFQPGEWSAQWIGENKLTNPQETDQGNTRLAARYLRKEFPNPNKVKRAVLYISGLGSYEAYINGQRIGEEILSPACSYYPQTTYYNVFDVSNLLAKGENTLGVILGNGRYFWMRNPGMEGYGLPRLLAQLEIEYTDGSSKKIVSDESWKITSQGPIIANHEFDGEEYDARKELNGWNRNAYNDSQWQAADKMDAPGKQLRAQPNPSIKVMERIKPITIQKAEDGKFIVDMGQNMVGRLVSTLHGKAGRPVSYRFAESLREDGSLFTANLRTAKATNIYFPARDGEFTWHPAFVYHGFRYVEIDGLENAPSLNDLTGEVIYDEMETTGSFSTSNPLINQIYKNAYWGIRGNYRAMPTDCPQRDERMGWLGDRATGCFGESFVFNNGMLYSKWMRDIEDCQTEEGSISVVSPRYWPLYFDDVTWPSAYFYGVEMLNRQYGDKQPILRHYDSMKRWVNRIRRNSMTDGIVTRDEFGDWCMPAESEELIHSNDPARKTDGAILSTTTFYSILHMMARFAVVAGHQEDAAEYLALASGMKHRYNEKFFNTEAAQYGNNTVTGNLLSLRHGLVPEGYEQRVFDNITEKTMNDCKGHVSTGVVGIQHLMRGFTRNGRPDIAYQLVNNTGFPSWGYMVKNGATTTWELWNGNTANPEMNSANHVMLLGDLIIWLYEDLAGIKNAEDNSGFRHIEMTPCFPEGLDNVSATYQSVSGEIKSEWNRKENFFWKVTIPGNCRATLRVPATLCKQRPNQPGIRKAELEGDYWRVETGSGEYLFQ